MFDQEPLSLNPLHFFAISCDCRYLPIKERFPSLSSYSLPTTQPLTGEEAFAKIAMGWNEEGLAWQIEVNEPVSQCTYPKVDAGDSVELFIDTRDIKTSGFNTRFCHYFFFLPEAMEGISAGEKTHFRTEDSHPLCDSKDLVLETAVKRKFYTMKIFIPSHCLHGYDPKQFDRLGFTYRINRQGGEPQHFSVLSKEYQIDQQPSLWGSLKLVK
jgi:hypothetical protein